MAQKPDVKPKDSLTVPLHVAGSWIERIGDAVQIGEWIVGYPPSPVPGDEASWIGHVSHSTDAAELEALVSSVNDFISSPLNGEKARRFLLRSGTFRHSDWYKRRHALESGLPEDVKKELSRNLVLDADVYLLRVEEFYLEWQLVHKLALIAGVLADSPNVLKVKSEVESAEEILKKLKARHGLPILHVKSTVRSPHSITLRHDNDISAKVQSQQSLGDKVRTDFPGLYRDALLRIIPEGKFGVGFGQFAAGLRVDVNVHSVLGLAYCELFANFSRGWKLCEREDCGNIFRVTDDKRKRFCTQYCGHLVSVRVGREKARIGHKKVRVEREKVRGRKQRRRASRRKGRR